jgi:hypothetical protein
MREILPSTSDGIEESTTYQWTPDQGEQQIDTKTGAASDLLPLYEQEKIAALFSSTISGIGLQTQRGRGTLTVTNARVIDQGQDPIIAGGLQELIGVDVVLPIYRAPYFQTLTTAEVAEVRTAIEDGLTNPEGVVSGGNKAYQLFGHLLLGYDSYYETAYLFRRTFRTSRSQQVQLAASNPNTVQNLPQLSTTLQNLIDTLPVGEWLKRTVDVRYLGREGWDVSDSYLWAPKWSIVYGGTFTGGFE